MCSSREERRGVVSRRERSIERRERGGCRLERSFGERGKEGEFPEHSHLRLRLDKRAEHAGAEMAKRIRHY